MLLCGVGEATSLSGPASDDREVGSGAAVVAVMTMALFLITKLARAPRGRVVQLPVLNLKRTGH